MNNEPVAWMYETELQDGTTVKRVTGAWELKYKYIVDACDRGNPIPLYTHPNKHDLGIAEAIGFDKGYAAAQAKTLTDEEIERISGEIYDSYENGASTYDFDIRLARAILRKAQEK